MISDVGFPPHLGRGELPAASRKRTVNRHTSDSSAVHAQGRPARQHAEAAAWFADPDARPEAEHVTTAYRGFRYPAEVVQPAVWLYHCFSFSLRDVETILAARGIVVSYETIRE